MNDSPKNPYATTDVTGSGANGYLTINQTSKVGMMITGGLIMGLLVTTVILSAMAIKEIPQGESLVRFDGDSMLFVMIGFAVMLGGAIAAFVLPRILNQNAADQLRSSSVEIPSPLRADGNLPSAGQQFLGARMSSTIIGQALLEGPAMVNAVFLLLDQDFAHLIPVVIAIVGILIQIPTPGKLINAFEDARMR